MAGAGSIGRIGWDSGGYGVITADRVCAVHDSERHSRSGSEHRNEAPATQSLSLQAAPALKERILPDSADHQPVPDIEVRIAIVQHRISRIQVPKVANAVRAACAL